MKSSSDRASARVAPPAIAAQIVAEGGRVTFARFMELALTHPTEGYYTRTAGSAGPLLGHRGHFSTAPYLSPAFGRALSRLLTDLVDASLEGSSVGALWRASGDRPPAVVELGGGEGDLAAAALQVWDEMRPDWRGGLSYVIVEVGAALRARQRKALSSMIALGWDVRWEDDLSGVAADMRPLVVIGNEFVDALPVHLIDVGGPRPVEAWVEVDSLPEGTGASVQEVWDELSDEASRELALVCGGAVGQQLQDLTSDGVVELRPAAGALMRQVSAAMSQGCIVNVDYGEWYSAGGTGAVCCLGSTPGQRYRRTVRGYFHHQLVLDPYLRVGRQDLTADVDFRALDLHGSETGFETILYTNVAGLLAADGANQQVAALRARAGASLDADREAAVLGALLDEEDLGGAFKVMLQVKE